MSRPTTHFNSRPTSRSLPAPWVKCASTVWERPRLSRSCSKPTPWRSRTSGPPKSCIRWRRKPWEAGCIVRTGSPCCAARSTAASGGTAKGSSAAGSGRPELRRHPVDAKRPAPDAIAAFRPGTCPQNQEPTEVIVLRRSVPLRRSAPLSRGLPPKRRVPVRKMRFQPRRGPDRSPEYLAWIRTLPCLVCSRVSGGATVIEAAHTNALGSRGVGQKTSDFSAIPLCSWHHRAGQNSYHRLGERWFAQAHQIHLLEVVQTLNRRNGRQIPWPIVSIS